MSRLRTLSTVGLAGLLSLAGGDALAGEEAIDVSVGHSHIHHSEQAISRVLVSDEEIVHVQLLEAGQLQILGLAPGTTDLWLWHRGSKAEPDHYRIDVEQDLTDLRTRVADLEGADAVEVYTLNGRLVLDGEVPDAHLLDQLSAFATAYDADFINQLHIASDVQVQLNVVFAEVSRSTLREMGLDAMWSSGELWSDQTLTAGISPSALSTEAFNIVGTVTSVQELSLTLSVLEQNQLSKTLARPTLVALSGQTAEFLAGGEIPIPVNQIGDRVTVEFREYGVKVDFVPTVLQDEVIDLDVSVEVSGLDPTNGVTLSQVDIPALASRRSASHVRLESGMTFAIAGLLEDSVQSTVAKVPLLGDIPILGALFRRVEHEHGETEILILVTPSLVQPMAPDEVPAPPGTLEDNNPSDFELFLLGRDHHGRKVEPVEEVGLER